MTQKKRIEPQRPEPPEIDPRLGADLLRRAIEKGRNLLASRPLQEDPYDAWELAARNYLEKAFGRNSTNVSEVMGVDWLGIVPPLDAGEWEKRRAESLQKQLVKLEALVELLEEEEQPAAARPLKVEHAANGNAVFVVHGHQHGLKEEVARFLEKLRQKVVILHEQPNLGKTLIEKFEQNADVAFAVVLLTSDDRGGPVSAEPTELKLRARQNVIFELGYFIGRLGRSRVCALYVPGVELPSDYQGVAFVQVDEGGAWRFALAKELRAADLIVDLNLAV